MFLIGYERLSFSHSSGGTLLLFLVFVTWQHLVLLGHHPEWTGRTGSGRPSPCGRLARLAVRPDAASAAGSVLSYLTLTLAILIALILIVDQPFVEILRRIHAQSRMGAQAAGRGLQRGRDAGASLLPVSNRKDMALSTASGTAVSTGRGRTTPPADDTPEEDRAQRAARVVERAFAGNASPAVSGRGTAAVAPPPADEETDETATQSKAPNLFNLTMPWRRDTAEEEKTTGRQGEEEQRRRGEEGEPEKKVAKGKAEKPAISVRKTPRTAAIQNPKLKNPPLELSSSTPDTQHPTPFPVFTLPPLSLLAQSPPAVSKRAQNELTDTSAPLSGHWSSSTSARTSWRWQAGQA